MKHLVQPLLIALAAVSLFAQGCEINSEPADTKQTDTDVEETTENDTDVADAEDTDTTETDTEDTEVSDTEDMDMPDMDAGAYTFVRVTDLSDNDSGQDPGADIDAFVLDKLDGTTAYADSVEAYVRGGTDDVPAANAVAATGAPDAFASYPDVSVCNADSGFVSLGAKGGYIIVRMGAEIEQGDDLTILEVGGCEYEPGKVARVEEVKVEVSVGFQADGQWVLLGQGEGPAITLAVPALP